jgi:hypothetical protein
MSGLGPGASTAILQALRADHGYTSHSRALILLAETMISFSPNEQRLFLRFVTGCPRLPVGGLSALRPRLTVVRRTVGPGEQSGNFVCFHHGAINLLGGYGLRININFWLYFCQMIIFHPLRRVAII